MSKMSEISEHETLEKAMNEAFVKYDRAIKWLEQNGAKKGGTKFNMTKRAALDAGRSYKLHKHLFGNASDLYDNTPCAQELLLYEMEVKNEIDCACG